MTNLVFYYTREIRMFWAYYIIIYIKNGVIRKTENTEKYVYSVLEVKLEEFNFI